METQITQLDSAIERPLFVGASPLPETNWKAVYNVSKGQVASIVSKDYEIIQHQDVARDFLTACANLNIKTKTKLNNHGNRIFIDVEFPDSKLYVQKGEEFIAGFRLINSYDKTTGIMIVPRLVRLVCSNGMIMDVKGFVQSFSYRHNQEMAKNFGGYIEKALKDTINSNDKLKAMVNECIIDSVEWEILDKVLEGLIQTKKHYEAISELMKDKEPNRWELYNAITNYATHGEQLSPNVEMVLQGKAQRVLVTPMKRLVELTIPVEN